MFDGKKYQEICKYFQERDQKIYALLVKHGYLQPTPKRNLFALLIGSIIGQRIKFTRARKLRGALYTTLNSDDFSPDEILNLGEMGLRKIGLDALPSETILRTAQYCLENPLENLEQLYQLNIKGIGHWTISCTAIMFTLNEESTEVVDKVLTEDLIIRRGLKSLYGESNPQELTQNWSPYGGIVTWYLWKEFS